VNVNSRFQGVFALAAKSRPSRTSGLGSSCSIAILSLKVLTTVTDQFKGGINWLFWGAQLRARLFPSVKAAFHDASISLFPLGLKS
jgi:hypothetical protein